ncbi:MAG: LysR family transcriptional regulator [Myxococcales bacterium]|nr:LysR family transcriptional regulator [Myxococcales bacterium]
MKLEGYDLNQIRALCALLHEAHVARAAQRLGITAPAASNALRRLREDFGDPLLVRAGRGLVRTPRGEALLGPARAVMEAAERVFAAGEPFDPGRFEGDFRVSTSDYVAHVLLGPLDALVSARAPGARLRLRPYSRPSVEWLREAGDLALRPALAGEPELCAEPLFDDGFLCVMRRGHPLTKGTLTVDRFAAASHVLVAPIGESDVGVVDTALAGLGRSRRVMRTVSSFFMVPGLVQGSDHIATLPAAYARVVARQWDLAVRPVPVAVPWVTIHMVWHRRYDGDPRHGWLRGVMREVVDGIRAERQAEDAMQAG